jgi:hypothetical protein
MGFGRALRGALPPAPPTRKLSFLDLHSLHARQGGGHFGPPPCRA